MLGQNVLQGNPRFAFAPKSDDQICFVFGNLGGFQRGPRGPGWP
jgi:hypothetical protein